jgi:hypothetical protein
MFWEKTKTPIFMFNNIFQKVVPFIRCCRKYGTAAEARDDNITGRMRSACWITKATNTHPQYVIHIDFPQLQLLRERTSMSHLQVYCMSC